jgi:hypothetical protein
MKKIIANLAIAASIIALVLTLTSCGGGLSGTYRAAGGSFSGVNFNNEPIVSIEFKPMGDAEITTGGWTTNTYVDSSYRIAGNQITLKAEWNYMDKWEGSYSFSESGNTVTIDGHEFRK